MGQGTWLETARLSIRAIGIVVPGIVRQERWWSVRAALPAWPRFVQALLPFLAAFFLIAVTACGTPPATGARDIAEDTGDQGQTRLTLLAAASLTEVFKELAAEYRRQNPMTEVILNFDGSQRLRTQLEHGAQADIFASADWEQMEALAGSGLLVGKPVDFAGNRLAFLVNDEFAAGLENNSSSPQPGSPADPASQLKELAQPGVKVVLALSEVPAGKYAERLLQQMADSPDFGPEVAEGIIANVVSREANARAVAQKVALGEADAGIAYVTDGLPTFVSERVEVVEVPDLLQVEARYPVAATSPLGRDSGFIEFILSEPGQAILEKNGFTPVSSLDKSGRK